MGDFLILRKKVYLLTIIFCTFFTVTIGQDNDDLESLISLLANVKSDTAKISLLNSIANIYSHDNISQSLNYSGKAYKLALNAENDLYVCKSVINYAHLFYKAGYYDTTLYFLNAEKRRIFESGDSSIIALQYILYGSALRQKHKYEEAKNYLFKGILYSGSKVSKSVCDAYNRIGIMHKVQGEYDSAITYYIKAHIGYSILGDSIGIVKTLINTGKVYLELKDNLRAEDYFINAIKILETKKHLGFESLSYINLGMVNYTQKKYDKALSYYEKAYSIAEEINEEINKGDIINNIGSIYFEQGLYEKALVQFEKSLKLFLRIGYITGELSSRQNIAVIYSMNKDYINELAMLDTVINIAGKNGMVKEIANAYNNIAITYYITGKYRQAYDTRRKWIVLNDSVFNIEKTEVINDLELKYEKEKNESKILALENEALQKNLEIKQKTNQRNLITGGAIGAVVILFLLFYLQHQRTRKDRIIKEKEILRLKEEKKALTAQSIVEGQEEERKRIARELHDGLGVLLSNVKMQFSSFIDKSKDNKELLNKAATVLNQASVDVRRISHNMMPGNLSKFGLIAAIEDLFEEVNDAGKITAEIKDDLADDRFTENIEIMIYRIIQELVNNTIKHSGATSISLNLNKFNDKILIRYADNGAGFDPEKVKSEESMGLRSIEDRINFLGGELSIETGQAKGASFSFDFPV